MQGFTYEYFTKIIDETLKKDFYVCSFEKFDKSFPKTMILRHDVDYTINGVFELAKIEASMNCSATFLFSCTRTITIYFLRL